MWLGGIKKKSAPQTEWVAKSTIQEKDFASEKQLAGEEDEEEGWKWLDGRKWGFQNWWEWTSESSNCVECECLFFGVDGFWSETDCDSTVEDPYDTYFICSSAPRMMSGNHFFTLKKDSLALLSPTFHFWPGQTENGEISISWKIENGTKSKVDSREFITKDLQGSVSTPGFGSSAPSDYHNKGDEYTVVIELPYNITTIIGDNSLVVDINVTVPDDNHQSRGVELLTTKLMLEYNSVELNWSDAEAYCVSKGGHLVSVSTTEQWQRLQTFLAEKNITYISLWFGGKYEKPYGWSWTDKSEWSVEPEDSSVRLRDCLYADVYEIIGEADLFAEHCDKTFSSFCMLPTKTIIQSDQQLVFTSENISLPALQFTWVSRPTSKAEVKEDHIWTKRFTNVADGSSNTTQKNSSENQSGTIPEEIGGFAISWQLEGLSEPEVNRKSETNIRWKPKSKPYNDGNNRNLFLMMNLVRESRINKVSEQNVWETLLRHRWTEKIIRNYFCLSEDEEHWVIMKTAQELNLVCGFNAWVPDQDLSLGMKLYSVVHNCPRYLEEAAKLSLFFETLLTNHSLNTVVAAILHSVQPRAGNSIKDFTAVNMWYERLDKRYNLSLGPSILGLMTTETLTQLKTLDPPYLEDYKESIHEHEDESMSSLFGKEE